MDRKNLLDKAHSQDESSEKPEVSTSLIHFWKSPLVQSRLERFDRPLKILELGCGSASFLEGLVDETWCQNVTAVDISETAIKNAQSQQQNKLLDYQVLDICNMEFFEEFDVVVDSHLYHYLLSDEDRSMALDNIKNALVPGGIFLLETMVLHDRVSFDFDLFFDFSNQVLWRGEVPQKRIRFAYEIEKEILNAEFFIDYFRVYDHLKMIPSDKREEAHDWDPDLLRALLKKTSKEV